jgi:predicted cupin superfamily sugar epimerase
MYTIDDFLDGRKKIAAIYDDSAGEFCKALADRGAIWFKEEGGTEQNINGFEREKNMVYDIYFLNKKYHNVIVIPYRGWAKNQNYTLVPCSEFFIAPAVEFKEEEFLSMIEQ